MQEFFEMVVQFFNTYDLLGLFVYSIFETITPLAGAEVFFVLLIAAGEQWWAVSTVTTIGNAAGAAIVYLLFGTKDAWLARKILKESDIERARKILKVYGSWAIFIFAMTPLPFFVILFVAAFVKMDFKKMMIATVLSRGFRFFLTNYMIFLLSGVEDFLGINKFVWIGIFLTLITIPIMFTMKLMEKRVLKKSEALEEK
jgi:membrane protein YqaA with SNARE-associated domain